jgi:hypothetical protein
MTYTKPTLVIGDTSVNLVKGNSVKEGNSCYDSNPNQSGNNTSTAAYEVDE